MATHKIPYTGSEINNAIYNALTYATESYLPLTGGDLTGSLTVSGNMTIPNSTYGYRSLDSNGDAQVILYLSSNNNINIGSVSNTNVNSCYINPSLHLQSTTSAHGSIVLDNSSSALKALNSSGVAKNLIYMTSGDNVSINGNGSGTTNVGSDLNVAGTIKTSSNGYLSVNGVTNWNGGIAGALINANGHLCLVGENSSNLPRITFVSNKKTTSAGYTQLRANNTTSTTYTITLPNSSGTVSLSSSDARLKENIQDSKVSAIDLINKIRLREFNWLEDGKEGSPHWPIGMIADELEEIDANLAFGGGTNPDGTMNVKGIDVLYLLGWVVKAIQELSQNSSQCKEKQDI